MLTTYVHMKRVGLKAYALAVADELEGTETDDRGLITMTPEIRDAIVAGIRQEADRCNPTVETDDDPPRDGPDIHLRGGP